MAAVRRFSPAGVAAPIGRYSQLAVVPAGAELIFISGQVGVRAGEPAGNAYAQTRRALLAVADLLGTLGRGPESVVRLSTFVAGTGSLPGFYRARDELFDRWYPAGDVPAHSLAVVAGLARPDLLVEIDGVAVMGG
ncbi:RidA family protein [Nonomuraea aridisoli]|uniref:RidA family protein n=1 Tax=Nonomuraea aridisoli TaxID=2070368 RepID=A0A2W2ED33_9ACTN|nr:RidA family protein [Nonomuraea aridisoli]PZG22082.1 RidA family protein [Nonomuraea aridisoli]